VGCAGVDYPFICVVCVSIHSCHHCLAVYYSVSNNIDDWLLDLFVQEYGTSIYTNEIRDPAGPSFPVGISFIRRRLSSPSAPLILRRHHLPPPYRVRTSKSDTVSPVLTLWADSDFPHLSSLPCLISVALFLTSQSISLCPFLMQ